MNALSEGKTPPKFPPSPNDDFAGWLDFHKRLWRRQRQERFSVLSGGSVSVSRFGTSSNTFINKGLQIFNEYWQVCLI
jgi:hypothetical protein